MPPKSTPVGFTIRLKNQKQTVLLVLQPSATIDTLKSTLVEALNETSSSQQDDDIPIPKPSFDVASDEEDESKPIIELTNIKIGIPVDKSDLSKGWNDITGFKGSIESNGIAENTLLAFTTAKEDDFQVEIPNDDRLEDE